MEVLLKRRCRVWCNTETVTHPQAWGAQHGGGRPLKKRLTLIYCIFKTRLVMHTVFVTGPNYLLSPTRVYNTSMDRTRIFNFVFNNDDATY